MRPGAEGDSPIFATAGLLFQNNAIFAAKIGTVPVNAGTCRQ